MFKIYRTFVNNQIHSRFMAKKKKQKNHTTARSRYITGKIDRQKIKTFLIPDDEGEMIFIPERKTNHAQLNDHVKVLLYARKKGQAPEGEVVEIIKRAKDSFVGILELSDNYAFLVCDNHVHTSDIFIPKDKLKGAKNGQIVLVKLQEFEPNLKSPVGEVIDILGNKGDNNAEMHAILAEFGLPYKYPQKVEEAAKKISAAITDEEIAKRTDMREVPTFSIDPKDAKDLDDALSIRKIDTNLWEVGVHIADVTHYVDPKSIIDKEAEKRGTSVYLVDRTVPMLPKHLSNGICSLNTAEDKLCYSVVFHMNENAVVQKFKIAKTVIRNDRQFSYEEAQDILETNTGDFKDELTQLNRLAIALRKKRFEHGAIAFERAEVKFEIDEKGKPLSVYFREPKDANNLIEEFMLLANKTVATYIGKPTHNKKTKTFVYRIHDLPDPEKLKNFSQFIRKFGYSLRTSGKQTSVASSINQLLDKVHGTKEQNLVETLAVRSMAKAVYTTQNIGHYGLAFEYYTHFTSPIRRYPDMLVHRLLERYIAGGKSVNEKTYEDLCEHASAMEHLAANAERASIKYKQVEFMSQFLGEVFDGVISGVTEWGIYVELLENKAEGLVPMRDLDDDYYTFDEKNYCLVGSKYHRKYQLGDEITVRVALA